MSLANVEPMNESSEMQTIDIPPEERLSDRELLLAIYRQQAIIVGIVQDVAPSVTPMIEKIQKHPMFKMMFGS